MDVRAFSILGSPSVRANLLFKKKENNIYTVIVGHFYGYGT